MTRGARLFAAIVLAGALAVGPRPAAGVASPSREQVPAPASVQPGSTDAAFADDSLSFPGLGTSGRTTMSGPIRDWGCRGGTIGPGIYRWGCAGTNNRYLLGHSDAGFAPLHDFVAAWGAVRGPAALVDRPLYLRLGSGEVLVYRVVWAGVWDVDGWGRSGEAWAWNATPVPSITLQTCFGAGSEYRIIVRAVLVG